MATTDVATYMNYVGGRWVEAESGRTYTITNPSPTSTASDIAFLSTVSNFIPGAQISMLPPSGFCGSGSNMQLLQNFPLTGDRTLSMIGGSLAPGASCTFSIDFTKSSIDCGRSTGSPPPLMTR